MLMHHHVPREDHRSHRSPWLRAAVLGANDGIISTTSIMLGVAAASSSNAAILTAGVASLAAGAMSMAVGEYVSVSSQKDSEQADIEIEKRELEHYEEEELQELEEIYVERGLSVNLAKKVAKELHDHDALGAHARDELGINTEELSNPFQAAWTSALSFGLGASLPIISSVVAPEGYKSLTIVVAALITLCITGAVGAYVGGGSKFRAAMRVFIGGAAAMAITAAIGKIVGVSL
jgi:VIT1/CCC1 family predicted Fe2+/Mn2+ transporter